MEISAVKLLYKLGDFNMLLSKPSQSLSTDAHQPLGINISCPNNVLSEVHGILVSRVCYLRSFRYTDLCFKSDRMCENLARRNISGNKFCVNDSTRRSLRLRAIMLNMRENI